MTLHLELGRSRWWVGVLAAALAMLLGTNGISRAAQAVPPTQTWVATHTRAHPVSDLVAEGPASGNESLDIVVTLHPSNEQQLPTLLADRVNRQSPLFRAWLTHDEVMAKFTPAPQDAQQVVAYLRSQGFTNVEVADGNFLVSATGSSAAVQRAFNTTLTRFRRPDQSVGLANTTAAFVPAMLATVVHSVLGLQTVHGLQVMRDGQETLTPGQFPRVYGDFTTGTASGTTVAILTEGSMSQVISDLHTAESLESMPTLNPTVTTVGGSSSDNTNLTEWDIDTQTLQGWPAGQ